MHPGVITRTSEVRPIGSLGLRARTDSGDIQLIATISNDNSFIRHNAYIKKGDPKTPLGQRWFNLHTPSPLVPCKYALHGHAIRLTPVVLHPNVQKFLPKIGQDGISLNHRQIR